MVRVKETHHVNFVIKDLEAARRFYGDVLSLPSLPHPQLNNRAVVPDGGPTAAPFCL